MTPEQFDGIVCAIAEGESMRAACEAQGVNRRVLFAALSTDDALANRYARAKAAGVELLAEEIIDIADAREGDVIIDDDGRRIIDNEAVQRARLRIDSRKWLLSKLAPKRYGDKLEIDAKVGIGDAVLERLARAEVKS